MLALVTEGAWQPCLEKLVKLESMAASVVVDYVAVVRLDAGENSMRMRRK